jgi:hypothetical protein
LQRVGRVGQINLKKAEQIRFAHVHPNQHD